ncbi:MAG: inositol monophosphatase family protein [Planctomycetota bacterium]|nr:inositol monophosphatase [Planctomycetota bacterium]MCX8040214.1 inositol monophosphatase [Planctomycetota bacterium]MDW8372491.1 inositol monophosphatase family protein [Planctomycetota bacterium]
MLGLITELARAGGRIAREHFAGVKDLDIAVKASRDYVSHVDRLIEAELIRRIHARHPEHAVLAEEQSPGTIRAEDWQPHIPLWIIDPLDGTTNYIHGIPHFAISIAFVELGQVRYGAVYNPVSDELFTAERGGGLWLNGQRRHASSCRHLEQALIATALPFRFPEALDDAVRVFAELQRRCDDQRRSGSAALDLAFVAVGRLDAYYELGVHPWDIAAGSLLVRSGGGLASDYTGDSEHLLAHRSVVAAATAELQAALLAAVVPLHPWLARLPCPRPRPVPAQPPGSGASR